MKKLIGILLVGLLGFSGCSGSDAGTNGNSVQAFGVVDEYGLSFAAHVMDQDGNLQSDAMLTINGAPMNIGFFPPEDLILDQGDSFSGANDQTAKGVECGDYQPYYFLDLFDVNEGNTIEFVAKGRQCFTFYSSTIQVPEKIRIIEPSSNEPLPAGEPVVVRWEGGEPCSQFQVMYYRGSDDEMFDSGMIQGSMEFTMPAHWTDEGWGMIFVDGCRSGDEDGQNGIETGIEMRAHAELYIEFRHNTLSSIQSSSSITCRQKCFNKYIADKQYCAQNYPRYSPPSAACQTKAVSTAQGCRTGCGYCK